MLKAIIVDDEISAVNRFIRLCEQTERVQLVASFTDSSQAYDFIKNNEVDLAYLDIEMPGLNGLELSKRMFETDPDIHVVFLTAYEKYAFDAFGAYAVGYLLKPATVEDIERQTQTIVRRKSHQKQTGEHKLTVNCFGQFSCYSCKERIVWKTAKSEELFAFLIHNGGKPVSKDIILDTLWRDMDTLKAANNLYSTWYYIRETLHAKKASDILQKSLGNYRILTDTIQCDFIEYDKLLGKIKLFPEEISFLEHAAKLYQGAYFDGKPYDWLCGKQAYYEIESETVLLSLSDSYVKKNDFTAAMKSLLTIIQTNPLSEKAYEKLIRLYLQQGDTGLAWKYYKMCEENMKKELNVHPSPNILGLFDEKKS